MKKIFENAIKSINNWWDNNQGIAWLIGIIISIILGFNLFSGNTISPGPGPISKDSLTNENILLPPNVLNAKTKTVFEHAEQFNLESRYNTNPILQTIAGTVKGLFTLKIGPSNHSYSYAVISSKRRFEDNILITTRVKNLVGNNTIEIKGHDVWFAVNPINNTYFVYESEENWTSWQKLPKKFDNDSYLISMYQTGRRVNCYINNEFITSFVKLQDYRSGPVQLCFKANPKSGGEIFFQRYTVWEF